MPSVKSFMRPSSGAAVESNIAASAPSIVSCKSFAFFFVM